MCSNEYIYYFFPCYTFINDVTFFSVIFSANQITVITVESRPSNK